MGVYDAGTHCWYPDAQHGWIPVEIVSNEKLPNNKYQIILKNESTSKNLPPILVNSLNDEVEKNLPSLRNPRILEASEDLTSLSYLNEPAVLHAIKVRYANLNIYTYSGMVLIATNPFEKIDQLYSPDVIQAYAGKRKGELEPHLFAIAEDAYCCMKERIENQTIVVSGESGAGKTVSAKYIMRYFASVESNNNITNNNSNIQINTINNNNPNNIPSINNNNPQSNNSSTANPKHDDMSETEKRILATNPIMESFGNAKTTRNDNSSRFGKYLEILFDKNISIIGARIKTYLLERSRLVFQPKTERNYHIFYQMLSGLKDNEKSLFSLSNDINHYHYLNQGGDFKINGVDDAEEFKITSDALNLIGINYKSQFEIWKILAGLLHIGNIVINATRSDAHLSSNDLSLINACNLLGFDPSSFSKWIIKKQIITRNEKIQTNLSYPQAVVARDSVAKYIYSALFDWLVEYVNNDLCAPEIVNSVNTFIGVLDIYGFEHFKKNSFEQFCINYANEKLQQEFNQHVFKLDQEEYIKEKINWSFIDFTDNQPCISLIEQKLGILSLLDEESRLPSGTDESWIQKMYHTLDKIPTNKVFKKPRFGGAKFIVAHYALDVEYDAEGFLEKNRDTVNDGHLETIKATTNPMLKKVLETVERNNDRLQKAKERELAKKAETQKSKPNIRKPTLGLMFKTSLVELMATINSTNVHYIRCIKPNEAKRAWEFDNVMVLSQLRACGVLETIRISCAGFPSRRTYEEFAHRYHILVHSSEWIKVISNINTTEDDVCKLCKTILDKTVDDKLKYQLGETKIFFKAGILANLEKLRSNRLHESAVLIQKNIKAVYYQQQYRKIRNSIINAQSLFRSYCAQKRIRIAIEIRAATMIQTISRGYLVRSKFRVTNKAIVTLQSAIRGHSSRLLYHELRRNAAASLIQKSWRSYAGRRDYIETKKATVYIQSCFRRTLAVKELKKLKEEAKSVNHLKEVSYRLENKVIELTQSLTAKVQENKKLTTKILALQETVKESSGAHEKLKSREKEFAEQINTQSNEHLAQIAELNDTIQIIQKDFEDAKVKIKELMKEKEQLRNDVTKNIQELKEARNSLNKSNNNEEDLRKTISTLKAELAALASQAASQRNVNGNAINGNATNASSRLSWSSAADNNYNPRPVSALPVSTRDYEDTASEINDELWKLLQDSKSIHKEIVDGLLKGLKVPPSGVATDLTRKEVLFPSRIIIIILSDMWRLGLTGESEDFLGEVLNVIQLIVSNLKDDDVITHGAFWLSNTHELYSFVAFAETTIMVSDDIANEMSENEYNEYLKLVAVVKEDFESLSYNIYNLWMKRMERELEKKAISAVVLSQSLPGFMAPETSPFLAKVFSPAPHYKMDDILSFFNSVYWAMKSYFIEDDVMNEVIGELLRFVDAICFNDLIMRHNFLSWKRGLQLNYNVTRLEEWCKSHDIPESAGYLTHLLQAAKLLQLRKNTTEDIQIIYEICYALSPSQIQKLVSQYYIADYETPIAPEVLQVVVEKVKESSSTANDYFEEVNRNGGQFDDPFRAVGLRPFSKVEAYVPAWLNVPVIKKIVELVAKNAIVAESEAYTEIGYDDGRFDEKNYYMESTEEYDNNSTLA
ncbi:myosin family protein [Ascoidea rubescens DSM 1968]|uniref:Myosin-2 n=1 Tax=Ascoidea rubescens DSM 1968 TaxID=1344418 RepID=A0A1D2VRU6_9ASCO|nr:myosin-2 [Ascoidea rubescens DSM 1968]ODV64333.1 myosin-2 [Ascoidea rubescens DSM 1968]